MTACMSCPSRSKEQVFLSLGPDWFLLLLQGHLHSSTTTLALKLLLHFLSNPSLRGRFRDGLSAGCWVESSMEGVDIVMGECVWCLQDTITLLSWVGVMIKPYPHPAHLGPV